MNAIFGGETGCGDVTSENFGDLLGLAGRVKASSYSSLEVSSGDTEKDWVHFIEVESYKR